MCIFITYTYPTYLSNQTIYLEVKLRYLTINFPHLGIFYLHLGNFLMIERCDSVTRSFKDAIELTTHVLISDLPQDKIEGEREVEKGEGYYMLGKT